MTGERRHDVLSRVKTLVVKVGTNVLSTDDDRLDGERIASLAMQVNRLRQRGINPVLVSSGAIGAGMTVFRLTIRKRTQKGPFS